ncbi:hypothetical protein ES705_10493 [subsurface metagenome]
MSKLYKTITVTTVASDEVVEDALISTDVEKKKVLACYPDDSLTTSEFAAYIEREEQCHFRIDNLLGEASKRIAFDLEIPVGQTFFVGYKNPAGVEGDKYVVIEYELV